MRIVIYGNFVVDYCSEVHHAKTLEALGHEVIRLQETEVTTESVMAHTLDSDLLIWIHSHGFHNKGGLSMPDVLQILKNADKPTLAYHLDLYMGLERWREYEKGDYFQVEHFFTVDRLMAEWLNNHTETKGHYIPAGVFHEETYLPELPKTNDVLFVGSRGYHKEWPYRPQLVDWLRVNYGERFQHYGGDGLKVVRGHALNNLYASSKIVVGDTLCPGFTYPDYFSDRVFETTGRGGFIIHPYISGLERYFKLEGPDQELVTYRFGDFDDLRAKIDYYLEHAEEREQIRARGHARTKRDHTYLQRWTEIISKLMSK